MKNYKSLWTIGFGIFFVLIGTLILLDNLDILYFRTVWSFFWPLLLIIIGLIMVFKKSRTEIISDEETNTEINENTDEETYSNRSQRTTVINENQQTHYFGNVNYASHDKNFSGLNLSNIFGDILVDISNIDFDSGEKFINVNGIFGSIKILLPKNIPVKFIGSTLIGSVKFLDKDKDGLLVSLNSETLDFDEAAKKIIIRASIVFGDIVSE